jgi:5'-nucleotidase
MKRRTFIRQGGLVSFGLATGLHSTAFYKPKVSSLTILHTNDVHSRIEAFPQDGSKYAGLGGAAKRAKLIEKIREEQENVLLLDCGDIFQGTPYFNFFGGELEFKLMSEMKYDAATIGNHDFDAGIDGLHKQMGLASFEIINCNYNFGDTVMNGQVKPYKVFQKGEIKVGVLGAGIELDSLVPKSLYKETKYLDPIQQANKYAKILKQDLECHYVICLSHLGYKYKENKVSDHDLAAGTQNIDLILGGHTHTFLKKPTIIGNKVGRQVHINQVGWAGLVLGQMQVNFEKNFKNKCITCDPRTIR